MPTPLTHGLVGAALAQATPSPTHKIKSAAVFAMLAIVPDIDLASFHFGIPYGSTFGHRGFFHSLTFAAFISVIASLLVLGRRWNRPRVALPVFALAFVAAASHGVLDAATTGGEGVAFFMPFSEQRFFLPLRPIVVSPIDPNRFLARASQVLASETTWVLLPLAVLTLFFQAIRVSIRTLSRSHDKERKPFAA